jgi:pimeloyl-ACP methyl ester carboxylesterase
MVAYEQVGDPAGVPVFVLHGTPNSRLSGVHPNRSRVADAGLRLIGYDRPGYGHSIRQPGRRIIDCVGDVAAIANELELERFAVAGRSAAVLTR